MQPLRESRDRYEELKQIDDAMNEVGACVYVRVRDSESESEQNPVFGSSLVQSESESCSLQVQKMKSENLTIGGKKK